MEIAVWIVAPNGYFDEEVLEDPDTAFFFNEDDALSAAEDTGPSAKVFMATTTFDVGDFSRV